MLSLYLQMGCRSFILHVQNQKGVSSYNQRALV